MQPGFGITAGLNESPPQGLGNDPTIGLAIGLGVALLIMLLRIRRLGRKRKVRIERMWIGPVIFIVLAGFMIQAYPPPNSPIVYMAMAAATGLGAVMGWFRGKFTRITVDVESQELMSQVSPWALAFLLVLILARLGLRRLLGGHVSAAALTDSFLVFYVGSVVARRVEIFLRCRRILAEAKAAKASGETAPSTITEDHA